MRVFIEVLARDSKQNVLVDKFWEDPWSAETKPVLVNPKGFTKTCFITAFCNVAGVVYIANPYLSHFVRLQHQPFPNIVLIIQLKMRSMFPPAASSSLPLPICYRSPPVIPSLGDCFPCGSNSLGKYVLYSSALRQRARWHTSLARRLVDTVRCLLPPTQ